MLLPLLVSLPCALYRTKGPVAFRGNRFLRRLLLKFVSPLHDAGATRTAKQVFHTIQAKFGMVPHILRVMGLAPAIPQEILAFDQALQDPDSKLRELANLKASQLSGLVMSPNAACAWSRR
jgi:hypothetical protein